MPSQPLPAALKTVTAFVLTQPAHGLVPQLALTHRHALTLEEYAINPQLNATPDTLEELIV